MTKIDHFILKVKDLDANIAFYTGIMDFTEEGRDGPFTLIRASEELQIQLAPWGTAGGEHYAFAVSRADFDAIFSRIRAAEIPHGPTFDSVGSNTAGAESGARGMAPTLYFFDPNKHLLEIRTYERTQETPNK